MLRRNKVLTSLDVQFCGFGPKVICAVCRALEVNTTLTSLDLSGSQFDDISIASLGKLLIVIKWYMVHNNDNNAVLVLIYMRWWVWSLEIVEK